eukprot:1242419-Rhodomonas_salina.4
MCHYTPIVVGAYTITVLVGRGGLEYEDIILGVDKNPTNALHELEQGVVNSSPVFALAVKPGVTHPGVSSASGDSLTLTTAGTAASFTIVSRDAFGNRRPGGDSLSVLMLPAVASDTDDEPVRPVLLSGLHAIAGTEMACCAGPGDSDGARQQGRHLLCLLHVSPTHPHQLLPGALVSNPWQNACQTWR